MIFFGKLFDSVDCCASLGPTRRFFFPTVILSPQNISIEVVFSVNLSLCSHVSYTLSVLGHKSFGSLLMFSGFSSIIGPQSSPPHCCQDEGGSCKSASVVGRPAIHVLFLAAYLADSATCCVLFSLCCKMLCWCCYQFLGAATPGGLLRMVCDVAVSPLEPMFWFGQIIYICYHHF